jgi:hypothetical protein
VYHLRRNTPPEVIRVGSVADLATGAALANRRVPRDLLLLATRCALLALTALALARPTLDARRDGRRWIVAPSGEWTIVDSLEASGAVRASTPASPFPWSSATVAAAQVGATDTLLIVAPDDGNRYLGPRPALHASSTALGVPTPDSAVSPGPPVYQRSAAVNTGRADRPRRNAAMTLWWVVLGLAPIERLLARRSRDAG